MILLTDNNRFAFHCDCGFRTPWRHTLEAAGREADLHMAEKYPIGTQRKPCEAQPGQQKHYGLPGQKDFATEEQATTFAQQRVPEFWIVHVTPVGDQWRVNWWCQ